MITQISHALRIVEPSMTDRIEGISVVAASSGNRLGPVLPTGQHRLEFSPSVEPRLPHTTKPVLRSIPHPDSPFFRLGADSKGPPVCAICLGRNICEIGKCRSENFWDGSKVRCQKNEQGRLITPTGTILCHDWNTRRGCPSTVHGQRHECSGCGKRDHGAQNCARAQKENPLTPYKFKAWDRLLRQHNLLTKYPKLVASLQNGFHAGLRRFYRTFTPPNGTSLDTLTDI